MATKLNKKAGDMITLKDTNNKVIKAKIKGVFTNYVGHHIYASESLYKSWNTKAKTSHTYLIKSKKIDFQSLMIKLTFMGFIFCI